MCLSVGSRQSGVALSPVHRRIRQAPGGRRPRLVEAGATALCQAPSVNRSGAFTGSGADHAWREGTGYFCETVARVGFSLKS